MKASPKPRLFALIIGINHYDDVRSLRGATADALFFRDYLENRLKVPTQQIRILLNKSASRSAIIEGFKSLRDDERIQEGDPIFIYYAGHGSELPIPESEEGSKVQVLVPQDYCARPEKKVPAIPDRTIGALIAQIAEKKGDNITLVFDCCHSASGTRGEKKDGPAVNVRSVELEPSSHDQDIDRDVLESARRSSRTPPGLLHGDMSSHVLLSACSSSEKAREINGHGSFSSALLKLLRSVSPDELRYSDILTHMDMIPHQNPQCEGANQKRYLFNSKISMPVRTSFNVALQGGQFVLDAGVVAGVTEGAEFVIHPSTDNLLKKPLGVLVVDKLGPFSTILKLPPGASNFTLRQPSVALRTKLGRKEDLRLYIPSDDVSRPCREALMLLMKREQDLESICLVDKLEDADFELAMENEKVVFLFRDQRVTQHGHTRLFEAVEPNPEELAPVLKAAAYFYWKLNRANNNPDINSGVQIELYKLLPPRIRRFDDVGGGLTPTGPNLYDDAIMGVVADENIPYGFKLTNNTAYDLYPNIYYFDLSDLSVVSYYEASSTAGKFTLDVPLPKDGGVLTIGYGSGGAPAQTFYLRPGQDLDVGFLKIFLSTKPVDLSSIPQSSPFERTRSSDLLARANEEAWATMLIPVIQRLSDPASLLVTQQKLLIQGLQEENVVLKREINIMHETKASEAQLREDFVVLKTELQKERDERERLSVKLLQEQAEKDKLQAALDRVESFEPEAPVVEREKKQGSRGWFPKKLRWW